MSQPSFVCGHPRFLIVQEQAALRAQLTAICAEYGVVELAHGLAEARAWLREHEDTPTAVLAGLESFREASVIWDELQTRDRVPVLLTSHGVSREVVREAF